MSEYAGLSDGEARGLQHKFGKNEFRKERGHVFELLYSNFVNPLSLLLVLVAIVSYVLGEQISSFIIFALILLNGILGFYQEYKSEQASEKLIKQITFFAKVKRSGVWKSIAVSELVPGDVVRVEIGDRVPADLKLFSAEDLLVDESVITGESYPLRKEVSKDERLGIAYMGTIVSAGAGEGIVTAISINTAFGKTAALIAETQAVSSFDIHIRKMSKTLVKIVLASVLVIFIINAILGKSVIASLLFAVALAVGLVPEALSVILTITLSRGALALNKHGVIVKRLSAIEDLGNVDILCTDKTGTLTENNVVVNSVLNISGKQDETVFEYAAVCMADPTHSNPIDTAIASRLSADKKLQKKVDGYKKISVLEFDYDRRRMSVLVQIPSSHTSALSTSASRTLSSSISASHLLVTKGSPESIIEISDLTPSQKESATKVYHQLGEEGYRAIAVAVKEVKGTKSTISVEDERGLKFLGFITFFDPPKKSVKEVLHLAKRLNLFIKLMSGDSPAIAIHTARAVGFEFTDAQVMTGLELEQLIKFKERVKEQKLKDKIESTVIFARVSPEQKHFLIKKLRDYGHSVAFLGDGVNDAPAIKEADVGISVNNGSDITKEAADIILLNKSLTAIIQGVSGGRKIFTNVVKYMVNTLAGNFGDLYTIGVASAFMPFIPLTPVQLLLANFLTDAPMVSISTDNVDDEELVKPKKWDVWGILKIGAIFGVISTLFDVLVILYFINAGASIFRTALFLEVIFSEIIIISSLRSNKPFFKAEPLSIPLIASILFTVIVGFLLVYSPYGSYFGFTPLSWNELSVILVIVAGYFVATEIVKNIYAKILAKSAVVDEKALALVRKKIVADLR